MKISLPVFVLIFLLALLSVVLRGLAPKTRARWRENPAELVGLAVMGIAVVMIAALGGFSPGLRFAFIAAFATVAVWDLVHRLRTRRGAKR